MTPIPPGTALRLLLLAWSLDDPGVQVQDHAWLAETLHGRAIQVSIAEYLALAPCFRAWGESYGIIDIIDRALENAQG